MPVPVPTAYFALPHSHYVGKTDNHLFCAASGTPPAVQLGTDLVVVSGY